MHHSLTDINDLPTIDRIKSHARSLAFLDAILMPQWEWRYFSFDSQWSLAANEMMGSMRDGEGNHYFILFQPAGAIGKVFYNKNSNPAATESIPDVFSSFTKENAFDMQNASYCFWQLIDEPGWNIQPAHLSEAYLLRFLLGEPHYYHAWAEDYYEQEINPIALACIYKEGRWSPDLVRKLNQDADIERLKNEYDEIFG